MPEIDVPVMEQPSVPVMSDAWEEALPDAVLDIEPETVPVMAQASALDWRIEVTANGRYWQWRKGRGKNRQSRYGGKFERLSAERQAAYYDNRRTKARTSASATVDAGR